LAASILATIAFAVLGVTAPARAHLGNISYSELVVRDSSVFYKLKFAAHVLVGSDPEKPVSRVRVLAMQQVILEWMTKTVHVDSGGPCSPSLTGIAGPDDYGDLIVVVEYACPQPIEAMRIDFHAFDDLLPDYQNIVTVKYPERTLSYVFQRDNPILSITASGELGSATATSATPTTETTTFREFFRLGVEHIWTGYDHLLFLLALLLPGGTLGQIAGIVTAFTIAHSITLSLATLGVVRLPPAPVEIAIAASIVYAAAHSLLASAREHRWRITFGFGLIHGFGFAAVLRESGLPPGGMALPLVSFNLGVEAGQLAIVIVAVPLLALGLRGRAARPLRRGLAWAIIAAGVFWMSERLAGWLGPPGA